MDFYLDERQRKKDRKWLKIKIYIGVFCFLLLLAGIVYVVVWSPIFRIQNFIGDENVVNQLKDFFSNQSKITFFLGPNNILVWNTVELADFNKSPEIAELSIEKDYLNHEIKIIVKEREKFGVWCFFTPTENASTTEVNKNCYWFDQNGVLFKEALESEGNLINKVDDVSGSTLNIGDSVLNEKLVSNLTKVFDVLQKSGLNIKTLKLERPELQEVLTESSPIIYFSLRNDPSYALSAIESLKAKGLKNFKYIDLRVENRAYYH